MSDQLKQAHHRAVLAGMLLCGNLFAMGSAVWTLSEMVSGRYHLGVLLVTAGTAIGLKVARLKWLGD